MSLPDFSLNGKVAIVTGARRGISKAIAIAYAEAGADVVVCDVVIEDGELTAVANEIKKLGRRSLAIRVDVSHRADVENMAKNVKEQFGFIDVLTNGAAILYRESILEMPENHWDRLSDINFKGVFLCSQAVGRVMKEQKKGSIINVASDLAIYGEPASGAYSAAKAGVVMLTRSLSGELGGYGIRANCIAPGLTRTEMSRKLWENDEFVMKVKSITSLGRLAEPEDMVGAAIFLASDASSFITGNTIIVNGGRM